MMTGKNSIGIRLTDTAEGRNSASLLISKMYAWRGYAGEHKLEDDPNRLTLTACDQGEVVGTLTIGLDSHVGLLADAAFKEEIDRFREAGARICEVSKFAFDTAVRSKLGLASMFHLALIYARDFYKCTHVFIEVNPRHRRFYEQMLGFRQQGEMKINARVNAPAYLLAVDLEYVTEQIRMHGGTGPGNTAERSFFPLFFSAREERAIIERLRGAEQFHVPETPALLSA